MEIKNRGNAGKTLKLSFSVHCVSWHLSTKIEMANIRKKVYFTPSTQCHVTPCKHILLIRAISHKKLSIKWRPFCPIRCLRVPYGWCLVAAFWLREKGTVASWWKSEGMWDERRYVSMRIKANLIRVNEIFRAQAYPTAYIADTVWLSA